MTDPETGGPIDGQCRPIACDTVDECSPGFSCTGGICRCAVGLCVTTPGHGRVEDEELLALCLADQPRSALCEIGAEELQAFNAVASSCDEETDLCSVPSECQ